jgi:DNA-binding NarL/FixJ family response regulator
VKPVEVLTRQEQVVLSLVAQGWRSAEIARELSVSRRTVENHLNNIYSKLGASSRTEAVFYAMRSDLLRLDMIKNAHDIRNRDA